MKKLNWVTTLILAGSLLLQLSTFCFQSHGAAGDLDLSFDAGSGINGPVKVTALQPDGKVIIAGTFSVVRGLARTGIARLNADGSGDPSFNADTANYNLSHVRALALQSDGKILINHDWGVIRLNSNGSVDGSFGANLYYPVYYDSDPWVNAIAVQPDGKVVVGGSFATENGTNVNFGIARFDTNGALDPAFNANSAGEVSILALQPGGKLLAGGYQLVRYNTNGSQDMTFSSPPEFNYPGGVLSLAVQPDAKLLVGGYFFAVHGTNRNGIARLDANGTLDATFNPGTRTNSSVRSIALQADGRIVMGGFFSVPNDTNHFQIARVNANGSADETFSSGSGANDSVETVLLQPDGKVIASGWFTTINGTNRNRLARLNSNGSLDLSFDPGRGVSSGVIRVQSDGKVLVGNTRLNSNGSFDSVIYTTNGPFPPFPADLTFPGSDYTVTTCGALQPDGKQLIGGYFHSTYEDPNEGGITRWTQMFLRRFNADASRDTNFTEFVNGPDYGLIDPYLPMALTLQPDGKILFSARNIRRLNTNGTQDTNFVATASAVSAFRLQYDGKIFINGGFGTVNGVQRGGIARLNTNGTLDNTFNPGTGANGAVSSFLYQPDGKMLIWGSFTSVNATNRSRIARLHAHGGLDTSFNPGIGPDASVFSVGVQPDGNILMSGGFTTVSGVLRPSIARLYGDSPWPSLSIARSNASLILSWPVTTVNFQLQENTNLALPNAWSSVAQSAVTNGAQISITVPAIVERTFFRLKSQ